MNFNLKGWNKIHSDTTHTTFKNKDEHEFKVAHSALTKENRKLIEAMPMVPKNYADGGNVDAGTPVQKQREESSRINQSIGDGNDAHRVAPMTQDEAVSRQNTTIRNMAQGGNVKQGWANPQQQKNADDMSKGASQGESLSDVADAAKSAWGQLTGSQPQQHAKGGKINAKPMARVPMHAEQGTPQLVQQAGDQPRQALAEGGAATDISDILPPNSTDVTDAPPQVAAPVNPALQAQRDLYNRFASGTSAAPNYVGNASDDSPNSNLARAGNPDADNSNQFGPNGEPPVNFNVQAWNKAQEQFKLQQDQQVKAAQNNQADAAVTNAARQSAGLSPLPPAMAVASQQTQAPTVDQGTASTSGLKSAQDDVSPQPKSDPFGQGALASDYDKGVGTQMAGINAEAKALGAKGNAEAAVANQQADTQQQIVNHYQSQFNALDQERQHFQQDIMDQHIDPNHYLGSMDTVGRVGTAVGLILGGIGGAVTGQENPALKMLNMNIDRDIAAQKANLGKSENLLSANMAQFHNINQATDMTRIMMNDMTVNKLRAAEAAAQDPLAKGRAQQAIGQLQQQSAQMHNQLAMTRTMMNMGNVQDPAQASQMANAYRAMGKPEQAKALEERIVPGVGVSTSPVPQAARDTIIARNTLDNSLKHFYAWSAANSGSLDPKTIAQGKTMAAELQSQYRNSINGGVFKKGEQEFIDNIIDSDPTKFFNSVRVLPKLQEVMRSNQAQLNTLKTGVGLPVQRDQPQAPGPQYKTVNGVKYMRGPDGKAVPVK